MLADDVEVDDVLMYVDGVKSVWFEVVIKGAGAMMMRTQGDQVQLQYSNSILEC